MKLIGRRTRQVCVLEELDYALFAVNVSSGAELLEILQKQYKTLPSGFSLFAIPEWLKRFNNGNLFLQNEISSSCVRYGTDRVYRQQEEAGRAIRQAFTEVYGICYKVNPPDRTEVFRAEQARGEQLAIDEIALFVSTVSYLESFDHTREGILQLLRAYVGNRNGDLVKEVKECAIKSVQLALGAKRANLLDCHTSDGARVAKFVMALKAAVADEMEKLKSKNEKTGA